jgi:hypothetical protein
VKASKRTTIVILALTALFFAFTLLHASWFADAPKGGPRLVADRGVAPVRGADGCIASANSGYGAVAVGPDVAALQLAAGSNAAAVRVETQMQGGNLLLTHQYAPGCPADAARPREAVAEGVAALTKPDLFWQVEGGEAANALLAILPAADKRHLLIGDEAAVAAAKAARPGMRAFSIASARACAADYRRSLLGSVPESCAHGAMLLTLDELGFTLWGWPNRFIERMAKADTLVIVAQDVVGGKIKGLTDPSQYGEIANSFDGYVWVDRIEQLGPALRR